MQNLRSIGLAVALQVPSEYLDAVARGVAVGAPSERAVTLSQSSIALLKPIFSVELAASLLFNEIQQIN